MPVMDRAHVRREGVWVPPPLYPAGGLVAAWGLQQVVPLPVVSDAWRLAGLAVVALGIGIMVWAGMAQMRAKTSPSPWHETTAITAEGPYARSRNPIYVADLMLQAGLGLALGWFWAVILVPVTMLALHWFVIRREEAFLWERFGETYDAYRRRVRRWL